MGRQLARRFAQALLVVMGLLSEERASAQQVTYTGSLTYSTGTLKATVVSLHLVKLY